MFADQVVREIAVACIVGFERSGEPFRGREDQVPGTKQTTENLSDLGPPKLVAPLQNPDHFAHHDIRDIAERVGIHGLLKEPSGSRQLGRIILNQESHQDVRVEGDKSPAAPWRIASSISARVTPLTAGLRTPHRDIRSTFSGCISTTRSFRTRKETRWPVSNPSASLTSLGIVLRAF